MSYIKEDDRAVSVRDELAELEKQGVSLWLKGKPSSSEAVCRAVCLNEDVAYMRDYIFESGKIRDIRFDRVRQPAPEKSSRHTHA